MTVVQELQTRVERAILHVLAIARLCSTQLAAEGISDTDDEVALLREELDLLRARLRRVHPRRRPYYTPTERLRVLELRALRGWNQEEVADRFLTTTMTLSTWMKRCDESGRLLEDARAHQPAH